MAPVDITISPASRAEIPLLLRIEEQSQLEPWTRRAFEEEIERLHSHLLVARLKTGVSEGPGWGSFPEGAIAGFICFWVVADEIQILNIAVHIDFRRRGIGRLLLAHAIRVGREKRARCVNLEVRKGNLAARSLYESLDFATVGERPGYYGALVEPAILMELDLTRKDG